MTTAIPRPPWVPFLGNIANVDTDLPIDSFTLLARQYGEIYQLQFGSRPPVIITNSYELNNEICDESRFEKRIFGSLKNVREAVGDGLFSANPEEPNWGIAHRVLSPAFGPAGIRNMMDQMKDVCSQLIQKWHRFGPHAELDPSEDFTRLALDTLFLCSMNHRINSFYSIDPPPFANAMGSFLKEAGTRTRRLPIVQAMMTKTNAQWFEERDYMLGVAKKVITERSDHPEVKKGDLLDTMLYAKDPRTGKGLEADNIAYNLVTFMIAGHETTSGTLSFIVYFLIKHPEAMRKVRDEVDRVVGKDPIQYEVLSKLTYMQAVIRETLRLYPPANMRSVAPHEDTTLGGGKYVVQKGQQILTNTHMLHRDPLIWGDDAEEFKPERMLDGKFEALPKNAWQPFGYGMRACIGRPFAWQEILIALSTIFQTFELSFADPSYNLSLKQTLTVKPNRMHIHATPRVDAPVLPQPSSTTTPSTSLRKQNNAEEAISPPNLSGKPPIYILYGSNTGTSEGFAQTIANDAPSKGFRPNLGTLDSSSGRLPTDGPVIIVTASFEGQPADNAAIFVDWLQSLPPTTSFANVKYAVFGCGNPDWVSTFHRIPTLCDDLLEKFGAERLLKRGVGNVVEAGFFQYFDEWEAGLWKVLKTIRRLEYSKDSSDEDEEAPTLDIQVVPAGNSQPETLRQPEMELAKVLENRVLTAPEAPAKRHIELSLPEGMTYRAGDYLTILPRNPVRDVHRTLGLFKLHTEDQIIISSNGLATALPTGKPVSVFDVLSGCVELSQPATTRDLLALLKVASSDEARAYVQDLISNYLEKVQSKRLNVLSILETHSEINLLFNSFLFMLPSMRIRQYSISSSPLWNPSHATLTISIVDAPSLADSGSRFLGVASNFLASLTSGDLVQLGVRASAPAFHLPSDPTTPMVMFCAGTGFAPMRGFLEERAYQKESGRDVHPILCFFGCRYPEQDYIYSDSDIAKWVEMGILDIRPAFSRAVERSEGCKYVHDRVWHNREDVMKAFGNGAKFFLCGSSAMSKGVKQMFINIMDDRGMENASEKFQKIVEERFATDIFD